ncbi:adenosylcobinamide-GDP ribazoletransferase [Sporomusa acidovorans]|uniref:Adenosylcobinamide-GDP ribazoletransferase n=1 Tax=Sporomusa acidovorans (strain ATCC 49682 / DSM 3132 / Mol) TaxID=1123286 RepID=A0ABZ3J1N0_SPOA4|nr:adenosylcobinamide-GDP ribazoletransferase [Sporomusa acidovorans]OZC15060.1 cobalamin synthase [Sporomusa acidovorans DSM 3132]SDE84842.1 cobalamin-5'-phosphate synthase [Sporomusa acidovorans]
MKDFFTGLQFLTRIRLVKQTDWSPASFGRSVKYFTLVGALIGLILAGLNYFLSQLLPAHVLAAVIVFAGIAITGGLHCDGFMDTADGVFSGRSRERMLEIMKDSRVGANGVVAFGFLLLLKYSLIVDMTPTLLTTALLIMPVAGRTAMVICITAFPYARPEGMGKAFAQYAGRSTLLIAVSIAVAITILLGIQAAISAGGAVLTGMAAARYFAKVLGGLTGDTYGAVTELTELITLLLFVIQ